MIRVVVPLWKKPLYCYYFKSKELCDITIIYFHGKTGNVETEINFIRSLQDKLCVNVYFVEYPGYGRNFGCPSKKKIIESSIAVINSVHKNVKTDIYLFGSSFGGAVVLHILNKLNDKYKIKGCILENTFTSIQDWLNCKVTIPCTCISIGWLVSLIATEFYDNIHQIRCDNGMRQDMKWLLLSSLNDTIVPPKMMKRLYEILIGTKNDVCDKRKVILKTFDGQGHNSITNTKKYYNTISNFIRKKEK
jgi:pimeloyl-ACP methyl ester carboxylesterase